MFRRKYEFKPDRPHSGTLNKLYITPKQRQRLFKWFLTTLLLLAVSLLQDVIFSRVHIFGAVTDLVGCAILLFCIMQDPENGCVFALISSSIYYFSGSAPGSYVIALLTCLGLLISIFRQCYLQKGFGSTFLCLAGAMLIYELSLFIIGAFLGQIPLSRFRYFCITAGISLAAMPILYPVFLAIGKIGGESWKE